MKARKKRKQRAALATAFLVIIILISGFIINSMMSQPSTISSSSQPKAAIVDHLSLTHPNQTFIQTATNILNQAGYTVDYYQGEEVTVEFYRSLPTHNYGIIILRVHSVTYNPDMSYTGLFSSESYSQTKYVSEQLADQVQKVRFQESGPTYFAISSKFVQQNMNGRFTNSTIVLMGCYGLAYLDMAKAFLEKGAKVYIGWTRSVLASHTDQATTHLLQHLIAEKRTINESVYKTMEEVGPDPTENGLLMYYPLGAGSYTIQNILGTQVVLGTSVKIKHKELA